MPDTRKQGFHTVETNLEEMEEKIREHRRKIVMWILVAFLALSIAAAVAIVYFQLKEYTGYDVRWEVEREDSQATKYENFAGYILRYNNDGAFCADTSDNLIWNQAYEMQEPRVDICEEYMAIADHLGTQIYIMNTQGVQGQIETSKPIQAVRVANQGMVAVLTQEDETSHLELYSKSGNSLASGEIHVQNSGYPMDIALSNDGNKLAVSILDISSGKAKSTIAFYNFGSVGQNEIDNIVGSYVYKDTVIPQIDFVSNDRMIAFGDTQVILFEGTQKPEEKSTLKLDGQVKSIFYDRYYFGLVYGNGDSKDTHKMQVYDMKGKLFMEKDFSMAYSNIEFLENHQICITNDTRCEIYTLRGVKHFAYVFDNKINKILSGSTTNQYTFILDGIMQRVCLKAAAD